MTRTRTDRCGPTSLPDEKGKQMEKVAGNVVLGLTSKEVGGNKVEMNV